MNIESNVVIELLELERWLINKNDRLFEFPSTSIKLECLLVLLLHTHLNEISVNSINKKHQSCCCNRSEYDGGCILCHLHFIHYRFFVSFLKCLYFMRLLLFVLKNSWHFVLVRHLVRPKKASQEVLVRNLVSNTFPDALYCNRPIIYNILQDRMYKTRPK